MTAKIYRIGPLLLIPAAILAYGYWHTQAHSWLLVTANTAASFQFFDDASQPLAAATLDKTGILRFQTGDCYDLARESFRSSEAHRRWKQCSAAQTRWFTTWATRVTAVELTTASCPPIRVPAKPVKTTDEWWLWWVPLPHMGGYPYTLYSLAFEIDPNTCTAKSGRIW